MFPIQESNPGLTHCRQILYHLSLQESPNMPLYFPICGSFLLFLFPYKTPSSAFAVEVLLFFQSYIHQPVGPHLSPPEVIPNSPLSPFQIGIFCQVKHSIVIFFSPQTSTEPALLISRWMIQLPCFLGRFLPSQGERLVSNWSVIWTTYSYMYEQVELSEAPGQGAVRTQRKTINSSREASAREVTFRGGLWWIRTSLVTQMVKRLPTMRETQVQSLGREDLLEKEMAVHSSILSWKISWMEKPGRLQSMGSQTARHEWGISLSLWWINRCSPSTGLGLREVLHGWSWVCGQEVEADKVGKEDRKQLRDHLGCQTNERGLYPVSIRKSLEVLRQRNGAVRSVF